MSCSCHHQQPPKEELNTAQNALFLVHFPSLSESVHSQILRLKWLWIKEPWANSSSINVASGFGTHVQLQHPDQLWQWSVPTLLWPWTPFIAFRVSQRCLPFFLPFFFGQRILLIANKGAISLSPLVLLSEPSSVNVLSVLVVST